MYALNLDKETKRVLSATFPQYATADAIIVDYLPEGNICDYIYRLDEDLDTGDIVGWWYDYDPLPEPEEPEASTEATLDERVTTLEEELAVTKILLGVE